MFWVKLGFRFFRVHGEIQDQKGRELGEATCLLEEIGSRLFGEKRYHRLWVEGSHGKTELQEHTGARTSLTTRYH